MYGGALGLPLAASSNGFTWMITQACSFVASLSRTSNPAAMRSSLLTSNEYPVSISLGRRSSFVLTSTGGRCFSFGCCDDGMLGLGEHVTEAQQPSEIVMPEGVRHDPVVSLLCQRPATFYPMVEIWKTWNRWSIGTDCGAPAKTVWWIAAMATKPGIGSSGYHYFASCQTPTASEIIFTTWNNS